MEQKYINTKFRIHWYQRLISIIALITYWSLTLNLSKFDLILEF